MTVVSRYNSKQVYIPDELMNKLDTVYKEALTIVEAPLGYGKTTAIRNLFENTDFRNMNECVLKDVNIVTIDVSFISVTKLISKIAMLPNCNEIVCLIKPQFECGKENADKYKGIVLNKAIHNEVICNIINNFKEYEFISSGLTFSPIKGGNGNIEYLLYLKKNGLNCSLDITTVINSAFKCSF